MRHDIGASSMLDAERGDVESLLVLALDHVMRKHSVVAGDQLRDRVAEHRAAAVERHIVLDERSLAVFLGHNEVARMAHRWSVFRSRNKQQEDGLLHERASGDVYTRSVFRKSRVQCTEGIAADIKVASEVLFNRSGIAGKLLGETADLPPIRQFAQQRQ